MIAPAHRQIKLLREVRQKVKDRRRVRRHTHLQIRQRKRLRRRQPADIDQPVAEPRAHPRHQLDIAHAVLEPDQVWTPLAQPRQRRIVDDGVVAVVNDHAQFSFGTHRLDMRRKAGGLGVHEIRRQQQNSIGALQLPQPGRTPSPSPSRIRTLPAPAHVPTSHSPPHSPPTRTRSTSARKIRPCRPLQTAQPADVPAATKYVRDTVLHQTRSHS